METLFVVTRQNYCITGDKVVEIAQGGRDYAGSDALSAKYAGEFEEFQDPREAVEVAVGILKQWRKDANSRKIGITMGCNYGTGMAMEPMGIRAVRKTAKQLFDKLPKCSHCGGLLGKETYTHEFADDDKFCREYCAEQDYARYFDTDEVA